MKKDLTQFKKKPQVNKKCTKVTYNLQYKMNLE